MAEMTQPTAEVRLEIDLNVSSPEGYARVRRSRIPVDLQVGESVIVFESEDQLSGPAQVARVDESFAYLDVKWDAMAHDSSIKPMASA
ncbi:hypothetical protein OHV05_18835 [Kitasatospora sp. NBC_00070]|uniref:hypothetical protein n=1 Tax=Kitasatospora sp. NBC_00070 TaxID=2975962 RepID=UPI00324F3EE8